MSAGTSPAPALPSGEMAVRGGAPGLRLWLMAARPRTLVAAVVPVAVGTAVAAHEGSVRPLAALAALAGALLIQVATNLVNDYYDFVRGADTAERVGPTRVTQAGLIAPSRVLAAAGLVALAAMGLGSYLVWLGGWPIVIIGLLSLLAGFAYTGGPYPLGYHGLGDVFVFVFFGIVAVSGTAYVQTGSWSSLAFAASIPVGALSTALIVVNNLRDAATDAKTGKRTLAVRLGESFVRGEYVSLLVLAFATPLALWALGRVSPLAMLAWIALPLALAPLRLVRREQGAALNRGLALTARLQLAFGLLFAIGLLR